MPARIGQALRRELRRGLRRALHHLREPRARFIFDKRYVGVMTGLPMDVHRAENIAAFLAVEQLVRPHEFVGVRPAPFKSLRLVHSDDYLYDLSQAAGLSRVLGIDVAQHQVDEVLMLQRLIVGGTKHAVHAAAKGEKTVVHLGGGLHHARPTAGHGFCAFNDVAIAIRSVRERGFSGRVLVVDLDVHDGDGTRICLADDPTVHKFSIHNQSLDDAPALEATSLALGKDVTDAVYLQALREHLPEVVARFRPQLVIYLAGADPAADDRLGNWRITEQGMLARDRFVVQAVRAADPHLPLVVLLAGGYGANAWRYSARFVGELARGRPIEPPRTEEMMIARMRHLRSLHDPLASDELIFSEDDITGDLSAARYDQRLLGHYTLHMIELGFERYGLYDRLRQSGFTHPTLEWNLRDPMGHVLKMYGDANKTELVAETCLRRERTLVTGCEVLYVEWLMLQNPRAKQSRPLLPGQKLPGLGLLPEALGLFVMMCERLGLDGVAFVPGHFHLAALGAEFMRMLHPEDEALLRALLALLEGRPLVELAWALSNGKVHNGGAPVKWSARPMVLPIAGALRDRVYGKEYIEAVAAARAKLQLEVVA